jgi:hypothetical protein
MLFPFLALLSPAGDVPAAPVFAVRLSLCCASLCDSSSLFSREDIREHERTRSKHLYIHVRPSGGGWGCCGLPLNLFRSSTGTAPIAMGSHHQRSVKTLIGNYLEKGICIAVLISKVCVSVSTYFRRLQASQAAG